MDSCPAQASFRRLRAEGGREFAAPAVAAATGDHGAPFVPGIPGRGEIAERCALRPSTASEHLSLLRRGGPALSRKEGKQVYHRADGATMAVRLEALREYLARCCPPGHGD
ncbi:hypothetical protein [Streptomyces sp. TRM75563]|uniref:ArsR/SmtB family transcription factor n=1 Tax=Streptomyces sp. TRM75563 TaxID=2817418 RepID=UPI001F61C357|nr:hypothetical protein [Streptomyces sp. TRM75563]MCI4045694.1 hypothetical protein [Streptomyces sp. TRM75563]